MIVITKSKEDHIQYAVHFHKWPNWNKTVTLSAYYISSPYTLSPQYTYNTLNQKQSVNYLEMNMVFFNFKLHDTGGVTNFNTKSPAQIITIPRRKDISWSGN